MSVQLGTVETMTTSHTAPSTEMSTMMVANCPEDLLAFIPIALGFAPAHSVVLVGVRGVEPFHARLDLPEEVDQVDDVVEALLRPTLKHGVDQVILVIYDDDTAVADETAWSLIETFAEAQIEVIDVLRAHDRRYYAVLPGRPLSAYRGTPFEPDHHRFAAQSVFGGKVTLSSREELAATLDHDPVAAVAVSAALDACTTYPAAQIRAVITEHSGGELPTPPDVIAALALSITDPLLRDEAWGWLTRASAREHIDFWSDVVRRVPEELVPAPAAVLSFVAWLAGEGALAWCAVERAREGDPGHSLARLVDDLLTSATSPEVWKVVADSHTP